MRASDPAAGVTSRRELPDIDARNRAGILRKGGKPSDLPSQLQALGLLLVAGKLTPSVPECSLPTDRKTGLSPVLPPVPECSALPPPCLFEVWGTQSLV